MSETLQPYPVDQIEVHRDRWTTPFWDAAAEHRLVVPRCIQCGRYRFPPQPMCPQCRTQDVDWIQVSGDGTIYTFTVIRRGVPERLNPYLPYAVVAVALDDAPVRILANYEGESPDDLRIGLPVSVCWATSDSLTVPHFQRRP